MRPSKAQLEKANEILARITGGTDLGRLSEFVEYPGGDDVVMASIQVATPVFVDTNELNENVVRKRVIKALAETVRLLSFSIMDLSK